MTTESTNYLNNKLNLLKGNKYLAYFAAVICSILSFQALLINSSELTQFKSSDNLNIFIKVQSFLLLMYLCHTLVFTAPAYFIAFFYAKKFQIKSRWFFIAGGTFTGIAMASLYAKIGPQPLFDVPFTFSEKFHEYFLPGLFSGFIAGLIAVVVLTKTQKFSNNKKTTQTLDQS